MAATFSTTRTSTPRPSTGSMPWPLSGSTTSPARRPALDALRSGPPFGLSRPRPRALESPRNRPHEAKNRPEIDGPRPTGDAHDPRIAWESAGNRAKNRRVGAIGKATYDRESAWEFVPEPQAQSCDSQGVNDMGPPGNDSRRPGIPAAVILEFSVWESLRNRMRNSTDRGQPGTPPRPQIRLGIARESRRQGQESPGINGARPLGRPLANLHSPGNRLGIVCANPRIVRTQRFAATRNAAQRPSNLRANSTRGSCGRPITPKSTSDPMVAPESGPAATSSNRPLGIARACRSSSAPRAQNRR